MAVRQHILPRFLLKGFASRVNKNEVYTWVYRKGGYCYETNIINVAVGKNFYGKEGNGSVDDKITNLESDYASLVDNLRHVKSEEWLPNDGLASLVCHLELRTKHFRDSFGIPGAWMAEEFGRNATNMENLKKVLLSDPSVMDKALEKELEKQKIPIENRALLKAVMMAMLPAMLEVKGGEILSVIKTIFSKIQEETPSMVKKGHIEALSKETVPEWRRQRYKKFYWYVCNTEEKLVLGDVGAIWEVDSAKRFTSLTFKADKIMNVFLPISSYSLLVGCSSSKKPAVDPTAINAEMASLSREFFVSSESNDTVKGLATKIGDNSEMTSEANIKKIVSDKFNNQQQSISGGVVSHQAVAFLYSLTLVARPFYTRVRGGCLHSQQRSPGQCVSPATPQLPLSGLFTRGTFQTRNRGG